MKVMILAAGLGTRLRPLTDEISKPMVPVVNKPIMEHVIELLARQGFEKIFANLHYKPEVITDYFGNGHQWGVDITYSYEPSILGTAGGAKQVESFLKDDTFLVFSSDLLTDIELAPLIAFHKERGALATIALTRVDDPSKYGVVLTGEDGRIVAFQEKPSKEEAVSNLVSCGIYVFEPEIFDHIPKDKFYDFGQDLFPYLFEKGERLYGFEHNNYWLDIGGIENYLEGNFDALAERVRVKLPGEQVDDSIWVDEGTIIADTAELHAPLCIGCNCLIENQARLIGPAVIGDNNLIAEGATFEKGIKWGNGHIGQEASVVGSIIGDSSYVSPQVEVHNASVVGANCVVGRESVITEGVSLGSHTLVGPNSHVKEDILTGGDGNMNGLKRCFAKSSNIVSRKIDEDVILVPIRHDVGDLESIYTLNEVATRIWELIDGEKTLGEVARLITEEFDVTYDQATLDLLELIKQLETAGCIVDVAIKENVTS